MVQSGLKFGGILHAGYELNYTINAENCQQIANIASQNYRVDRGEGGTCQIGLRTGDETEHKMEYYRYDPNGNLTGVLKGEEYDIGYRLSRARFDEPDELKAIEAGSIKIFGFQIVY